MAENRAFYEFEEFRVDPVRRTLTRDGELVSLTPKVFDLLLAFLENPGVLLEKDRLMTLLWADSFVEESNLAQNVAVLRRALGEDRKNPRLILTVTGRGYRFIGDVRSVEPEASTASLDTSDAAVPPPSRPSDPGEGQASVRARPYAAYVAAAAVLLALIAFLAYQFREGSDRSGAPIVSRLAVLPLKPADAADNYLGLGVADAVIRRTSQSGNLTVRPTSAVRRYLDDNSDALTAARDLGVDAVLEGTVQRAGDRLRVNVNLLRVSDERSLWSDSFDVASDDVFAIQDKIAGRIASSLQLRLDPQRQKRFEAMYTPNAVAYEYYLKGTYNFDLRGFNIAGKAQNEATIDLFKKSIEADRDYPLAHALLAYAYAWMGVYVDEANQAAWVDLAKKEIEIADRLDPQLAETHVARHHVLLSAHEGFRTEEAARELLQAKQLNPNAAGIDLSVAYNHLGLEDLFDREMQRTLEVDPTSEFNKMIFGFQLVFAKRFDEWIAYRTRYFDGKPNVPFLLYTRRLDEAESAMSRLKSRGWDAETSPAYSAILMALRGRHEEARREIPKLIDKLPIKNNSYHHATYDIACIYALEGETDEAVKWLRETAATGFPSYPLFERDALLDRIRETPAFRTFMDEMRSQNERLRREFGS